MHRSSLPGVHAVLTSDWSHKTLITILVMLSKDLLVARIYRPFSAWGRRQHEYS
jgi:hypothetical protein